jgi:hypothetical protein
MTPEWLDAVEKAARAMVALDEAGGAPADDEDAVMAQWDMVATPARVLELVKLARKGERAHVVCSLFAEYLSIAKTGHSGAGKDMWHQRLMPALTAWQAP